MISILPKPSVSKYIVQQFSESFIEFEDENSQPRLNTSNNAMSRTDFNSFKNSLLGYSDTSLGYIKEKCHKLDELGLEYTIYPQQIEIKCQS